MEEWARRIHEQMVAQGKIPADLARACKIKPGSVSGWFGQGKPTKMISGDNLVAAATFLNTSPEYIMTGRGPAEAAASQPERLDDETIAQGFELLYLLADARPDDSRFDRPTWPMVRVAAKAIKRAEGSPREAMAEILAELSKETY
ncbi:MULTISPECIES: helix-turn-helix transcriptional regulator [Xanthomonas]|uniref:helix-turn-helix transcriptional regulator n=1 Tax=Xanthomonas TaxID=338 RepID=UPI0007EE2673|nr:MULTISPECIES: helix-turn-helix transcriptional regulator [Xanthomonas]OBR79088.1 hypothetical protein A7D35_01200 [Xanthomonas arboricola]UXA53385.1 helix-turn-helix transcriptional regulator [Xanthomonas prunicola]